MNPEANKVEFHFIKGNDFRTVLASGVFGGITPHGKINVNFFAERGAIPSKIVYGVTQSEDPLQLTEIEREGKDGIIREVQFGILMDMNVAISFRDWLDDKIESFLAENPTTAL